MINQEELAICKRRGHNIRVSIRDGWVECPACGTWVREVLALEEREDAPPLEEQSKLTRLKRLSESN